MKRWTVLLAIIGLAVSEHVHSSCRRSWEKIACYWESSSSTVLWTDRGTDPSHNHTIDWKNYTPYLFALACRCKTLAAAKGFKYFGLRNFGVCTGLSTLKGPIRYLDKDKNCIQEQFKECDSFSESECMGKSWFEYVYKIGVDGGWSDYGPWGECKKSCGGGMQSRGRTCTKPPPSANGAPCEGNEVDRRACNTQPCFGCDLVSGDGIGTLETPIGAVSGPKECIDTCIQRRTTERRINGITIDAKTGTDCYCKHGMTGSGSETTWRSCKFYGIVDGGWSDYQPWSDCSSSCDTGTQTRRRTCTSPAPSEIGLPCVGLAEQSRQCNQWKICPDAVKTFPGCEFVIGDGKGGSEMSIGSFADAKACAMACFERRKSDPTINGATVDADTGKSSCYCEMGMTRVDTDSFGWRNCRFGDVVNGGWTDFSSWTACSRSCNGGTQSRSRSCTKPAPNQYGAPCLGDAQETRPCNQWVICAERTQSFPGCNFFVGDGSGEGDVHIGSFPDTKSCATACYEKRKTDPTINGATVDAATGKSCFCEYKMVRSNLNPSMMTCQFNGYIDGGWTAYGPWTPCSKSCNGGVQTRRRSCTNPAPNEFGLPCPGEAVDQTACNEWKVCPDSSGLFGCDFVTGDGSGGTDNYIGLFDTPSACVDACRQRRKSEPTINGATVDANTGKSCYCESNTTGSSGSTNWKTCKFA